MKISIVLAALVSSAVISIPVACMAGIGCDRENETDQKCVTCPVGKDCYTKSGRKDTSNTEFQKCVASATNGAEARCLGWKGGICKCACFPGAPSNNYDAQCCYFSAGNCL